MVSHQWKVELPLSVFQGSSDGQKALGGDAHHEEGLKVHKDVLARVPHVREEHDEHLVVEIEVKALRVNDEDGEEEDVGDCQSDQSVVESRFHLWPVDNNLVLGRFLIGKVFCLGLFMKPIRLNSGF